MDVFLGDGVAYKIGQKENGDDEEIGVVFALGDSAPTKGNAGGFPEAESGDEGRGMSGPIFKEGSEALAQKGLLREHDAFVVNHKNAREQRRQPGLMREEGEAQHDEIIAEVKGVTDDRVHAGGVERFGHLRAGVASGSAKGRAANSSNAKSQA